MLRKWILSIVAGITLTTPLAVAPAAQARTPEAPGRPITIGTATAIPIAIAIAIAIATAITTAIAGDATTI